MGTPQVTEIAALQARLRDLEAALNQHNHTLASTFRLSPANCNILGLLVSLDYVSPEVITQRLGIASDTKVALHRLRAKMKPFDVTIRSRRNVGYWLDARTKERIQQLLSGLDPEMVALPPRPPTPPVQGLAEAAA